MDLKDGLMAALAVAKNIRDRLIDSLLHLCEAVNILKFSLSLVDSLKYIICTRKLFHMSIVSPQVSQYRLSCGSKD